MMCTVNFELNELDKTNLSHLIPTFLLNNFKDDLTDRILTNLTNDLDILIESINTSNSFKVLSLNETNTNQDDSTLSQNESHQILIDVCTRLNEIFNKYFNDLKKHFDRIEQFNLKYPNSNNINDLIDYQRSILFERLSDKHFDLLVFLFKSLFDYYHKICENDEDESQQTNDLSDLRENHVLIDKFLNINHILFNLNLFDHLCGDVVVGVVENKIRLHIENTSIENYEESFIESFKQWLDKIILGWIRLIYSSQTNLEHLQNYNKQLLHFMYTNYAHCRIKRLFEIIIDFPDSKSAVQDLKTCLTKTNLRSHLIRTLKQSIEERLLHPGVNTSDILTAYVSAIKALMFLDPTGVMMENICEPLKKYLRNRDDTVKCIVSNLTDDNESSNDLMEEFCKDLYSYEGNVDVIDSNTADSAVLDSKTKSWRTWQPDPIDAPSDSSPDSSKSNIISMLVNIYGSKDMFVNEYKTLLGDRLLSSYSFNMEKEIRNLELLKLRFGEQNLFACEAMLKDISESKRINSNILEQLKQTGVERIQDLEVNQHNLKCLILSEQFWPKLKEEKIELPQQLEEIQTKFMKSYEAFKGNRTLIWKNTLGLVKLEIEVGKQQFEFDVSPIHAAVIIKFQEKETWVVNELASVLKMCSSALKKKILYWKVQGLLKQVSASGDEDVANEVYTLVKESARLNKNKNLVEIDEEIEKTQKVNEVLKENEISLYWNFTQSMLRSGGCLPLERIHAWLKLYANPDLTIEQVKFLVDLKTKEQLLTYNAGLYRLNK